MYNYIYNTYINIYIYTYIYIHMYIYINAIIEHFTYLRFLIKTTIIGHYTVFHGSIKHHKTQCNSRLLLFLLKAQRIIFGIIFSEVDG